MARIMDSDSVDLGSIPNGPTTCKEIMSVLLKRSLGGLPKECPYGCCTPIYGKNVKLVRRQVRRREKRDWQKQLSKDP